jgi:glycine/D-amino acid oxidase-like deaminating enzyme/nitrite reductase/ring-hydroxylating ferredoxin subunit
MNELANKSVWLETEMPAMEPLTGDARCGACIIGAGIAGLLTAERLSTLGMRVIVLDAGSLAGGETSRTTAQFTSALDDRYSYLISRHGARGAQLLAESHVAAIEYVEGLCTRLGIDCGWRRLDGYLVVNEQHRDRQDELLKEELDAATAVRLDVRRVARLPEPWPASLGPALRFGQQAQVHPLRLLAGLTRELVERGVRLFTHTRVKYVEGELDKKVCTEAGPVVDCRHVVVATNTPITTRFAIHTKQAGYQTYVAAFRVPAGTLPPLLLWDGLWGSDASYHYVRLYDGRTSGADDLLLVGGEDHKTGQGPAGDEPYRCLEAWTRAHFPMCGAVAHRWSGEVMEPADGVAFIGPSPNDDNVYLVTGDSGNGMTHGAVAALLIPDLILGREHPWGPVYDPARMVGPLAWGKYARENLNTLAQYRDWLKRGDVESETDIRPGSGAILVSGVTHLAVYKDELGRCTRRDATCPHLDGVVRWNDEAKTWDCPCHGSRFDAEGHVIHGPANSDLKPAEVEAPVKTR